MAEGDASPSQRTLDAQLRSARFLAGAEAGRWGVLDELYPDLYVRVIGRDYDSGHTHPRDFHLICDDYPDKPPFVERWDFASRSRPAPPTEGDPGFIDALKVWSPGGTVGPDGGGIYRAWQRYAADHNGWAQKRPDEAWHRHREISFVMEHLYALVSQQAAWLASQPPA